MNQQLLQAFLAEARDFLQAIGERLMQLEADPTNPELLTDLFRYVHTLKGNSGLFDLPAMTQLLHAAEDLMDAVRSGRTPFTSTIADLLLDAMDRVGAMLDELETTGTLSPAHTEPVQAHIARLRSLLVAPPAEPSVAPSSAKRPRRSKKDPTSPDDTSPSSGNASPPSDDTSPSSDNASPSSDTPTPSAVSPALLPPHLLADLTARHRQGEPLWLLTYTPEPESFYKGEDPFHQARTTPGLLWGWAEPIDPWPPLPQLDPYRSNLRYHLITNAPRDQILHYYRYIPDQIEIRPLSLPPTPALPTLPETHRALLTDLLAAQREILELPATDPSAVGRLTAVAATLRSILTYLNLPSRDLDEALAAACAARSGEPLKEWLHRAHLFALLSQTPPPEAPLSPPSTPPEPPSTPSPQLCFPQPQAAPPTPALAAPPSSSPEPQPPLSSPPTAAPPPPADEPTAAPPSAPKLLKVDQSRIDRLMNLIGEMVVAKNSLPYLAKRAEEHFGVRELGREIKAHYAVINRIAEEMQDAIMQIRMLPVSFVTQRFPRLVRDLSRKLGKEVDLILEGEETEADKTIIESLADPLIHLIRNALDHGIEPPTERQAAGKPPKGRLLIRARQESDRVLIEVSDDGRGIDPNKIKQKAYALGMIDESRLERLTDTDALHLIFLPGLSTAPQISDLSGRGVGMDVVKTAVEAVGGTISLSSTLGRGTTVRLSLPLSLAVTNVMIIEADRQTFGIPMDLVVETVRLPAAELRQVKDRTVALLRGQIVPLIALHDLLALSARPQPNVDGEYAILVVRVGAASVGLIVDAFAEVVDVILKPLPGALSQLPHYAGAALLGDGSVLLILNPKALIA